MKLGKIMWDHAATHDENVARYIAEYCRQNDPIAETAPPPKSTKSEFKTDQAALLKLLTPWRGNFVGDAVTAAYGIGLLVARNFMSRETAVKSLDFNLKQRKVDEKYRSVVYDAFRNGLSTDISRAEFKTDHRQRPGRAPRRTGYAIPMERCVSYSAARVHVRQAPYSRLPDT